MSLPPILLKVRLLVVAFLAACCILLPTFFLLDHQTTVLTWPMAPSLVTSSAGVMGTIANETTKKYILPHHVHTRANQG